MNKYPAGFVPVIVPQQFVVMPGAAVQLPPGHHPQGALQPAAAMLHHQHLAAQVAASRVPGASAITSPAVTSAGALSALSMGQQGIVSMAGLPPHLTGMAALPPHLTGMAAPPSHLTGVAAPLVPAVPGAVPGLHPGLPGLPSPYAALTPLAAAPALPPGLLSQQQPLPQSYQLQLLHHLHQTSLQQFSSDQDLKDTDDTEGGYGRQAGSLWQTEGESDVDELRLDDYLVTLDHFNSDLNLVIDKDGYGGTVLSDPPGFCYTWAGVRATYGVCQGKVFFEVRVIEHLRADFGEDHQEPDPHVMRVGWSLDTSSLQLGEEPWTFGYDGTGKFSTNNSFSDYAVQFEAGDVIGALLDLDSYPATISFMKNGIWYGVAVPLHGYPVGSKEMALFPQVLSKNCRFKVNFGQQDAWFPPPLGFRYIGHLHLMERVRGMPPPQRKSDCEVIILVGLPGSGKTTWATNMQKSHPEKRYNIIGTDTLIDKMKLMGQPRKGNYAGHWETLVDKATKCLNKLITIASKRKRNYILDQANISSSARKRKMKSFAGFYRIAVVVQPSDPELEMRSQKRAQEDGKVVQESALLEMKANFSLPEDSDGLFDRIDFIELQKDVAQQLVRRYNQEGRSKQESSQTRFDVAKNQEDMGLQQYFGYISQGYDKDSVGQQNYWYISQGEPPAKRTKPDPFNALDLLQQQYEEDDHHPSAHQVALVAGSDWMNHLAGKEESGTLGPTNQWPPTSIHPGYLPGLVQPHIHAPAFHSGHLGAPSGLYPGVQVAFLPPGIPPLQPSELALLSHASKARQESSAHPAMLAQAQMAEAQAQMAEAQAAAAALHGQVLLDPSRFRRESPYALVTPALRQSLYGAAPPGYESLVGQDSNSQIWQQAAQLQAVAAAQQQQAQLVSNWQQKPEDAGQKSGQQQGPSSSYKWSKHEGDGDKGSRTSSFSRPGSTSRNYEKGRAHSRDRGYDYKNNNKEYDSGEHKSSDGSYSQFGGSGLSSDMNNFGSEGSKSSQGDHGSQFSQPVEKGNPSSGDRQTPDIAKFNSGQFQPAPVGFMYPPPGYLPRPALPVSAFNTDNMPIVSLAADAPSPGISLSRAPPSLSENLRPKSNQSPSSGSGVPGIKMVSTVSDGHLSKDPHARPLTTRQESSFSPETTPLTRDSETDEKYPVSSPKSTVPPDLGVNKSDSSNMVSTKWQSPEPLIKLEDSDEYKSNRSPAASAGNFSSQSEDEQGNSRLLTGHDPSETDMGPVKDANFKPRGQFVAVNRFRGPPTAFFGPGTPRPPNMVFRPPRGSRGPPPHGGPLGDQFMDDHGPAPWNQNRPRFRHQGPPRPLFDPPPGRWPRPPR